MKIHWSPKKKKNPENILNISLVQGFDNFIYHFKRELKNNF